MVPLATIRWRPGGLRSRFAAAPFSRSRRAAPFSERDAALATNESGSVLVEFAITMCILFAFTIFLIQICFAYYSYSLISELAREGTRYAIVHGSTCKTSAGVSCTAGTTDVQNAVNSAGFPNIGGGALTVTPSWPGTGLGCIGGSGSEEPGCPAEVVVQYKFPFTFPAISWPGLTLSTTEFTLSSTSQMTILQ